jgi:hypothetical protein
VKCSTARRRRNWSRGGRGYVPRMLRSAISAFTRVFNALCGALLIRGLRFARRAMGPGSAEHRYALRCVRDTFAFHRDHHTLTKKRCDDVALIMAR